MRSVYNSKDFRDASTIENAISLLNQAIRVDSNYYKAYSNKFMFETQLQQYKNAMLTGKQMIKLRPDNVETMVSVGSACERAGDTLLSAKYYGRALLILDKVLDTMSVKNNAYKTLQIGKAIDLILLHQPQKGYGIFKNISEKETDPNLKQYFQSLLHSSRHDFLYWPSEQKVTYSTPLSKN